MSSNRWEHIYRERAMQSGGRGLMSMYGGAKTKGVRRCLETYKSGPKKGRCKEYTKSKCMPGHEILTDKGVRCSRFEPIGNDMCAPWGYYKSGQKKGQCRHAPRYKPIKGNGYEVGGGLRGRQAAAHSPWIEHVKSVRANHPGMSYKEALIMASQSYHKGSGYNIH